MPKLLGITPGVILLLTLLITFGQAGPRRSRWRNGNGFYQRGLREEYRTYPGNSGWDAAGGKCGYEVRLKWRREEQGSRYCVLIVMGLERDLWQVCDVSCCVKQRAVTKN